ncbi:LuxR C-terminal-related transcriptional regulator [Streptosporangium sp. CA-135522]|uniref:LuxR C-terminal-related transcriptional regulator n=1 Tax=Streptosporangium sp. CA-135522 TaxID=3240072 RepID=UPI003D91F526
MTVKTEISALVKQATGGTLLIRGAAGSGKSTLLEEAAHGRRTLRTTGIETEYGLQTAALDRLLRPTSLRNATDPFQAGEALIALLREGPRVVLVDDAHWLDRFSADALVYAARRAHAESVAIIFAADDDFDAPGVPELALPALDAAEAAELIADVELNPQVRERIVREAEGNPLALREFAAALTTEQRLGRVIPPPLLAVRPRVLGRFGHRLAAAVSEGSRPLLSLIAAERDGDLAAIMTAAAALGLTENDLAEAEGVLRVTGMRVEFRHPLDRAAAYYLVPLADRLRAHRLLSNAVHDPVRHLAHQLAATMTPDEKIAAELEDLARRADPLLAACIYDHAALLSAQPEQRTRRSGAAARRLLRAHDYERALPRLAGQESVQALLLAGDDDAALALATRQVARLREQGRCDALPEPLGWLARALIAAGRFSEARAAVEEAAQIATDAAPTPDLLAEIAALEGSSDGLPGLLELGLGQFHEALPHLEARWRQPDTPMIAAADLVEAAIMAGRPERAAEPLARFTEWAERAGQDWAMAVALRIQALAGQGEQADDLLARAVHLHERGGRPFERARTALLYGQRLRRAHRTSQSRHPLRLAAELFEHLGAAAWATRARAELHAAGEHSASRADPLSQLTSQERRIVRLAAAGVSNREIAAQLFISPRTVEYHLYKAYPKLGVASRHELHTVLRNGSPTGDEGGRVTSAAGGPARKS